MVHVCVYAAKYYAVSEGNPDICDSTDELGEHYAKWNKLAQKAKCCMILNVESNKVELVEAGSRMKVVELG